MRRTLGLALVCVALLAGRCAESEPELRTLAPGHEVRCHLVDHADAQAPAKA